MITQDQLKDIAERIEKLKSYLEIDKKLIEIENEEEKTVAPDFWNHPKAAEVLMKELRFKQKWVEDYRKTITKTRPAEEQLAALENVFWHRQQSLYRYDDRNDKLQAKLDADRAYLEQICQEHDDVVADFDEIALEV